MDDPEIARCSVQLRPGSELGFTRSGGLSGSHHFCFAGFQRPDRLEWGALRMLSKFELAPGAVRAPSFHSGFDIVTLVTSGAMRRIGTYAPKQRLDARSMELVSAGRGVNLGLETVGDQPATFTEIWLRTGPGRREPRREWRATAPQGLDRPFAANLPVRRGILNLRAAAQLRRARIEQGGRVDLELEDGERAYLALEAGAMSIHGLSPVAGDGLAMKGPGTCAMTVDATAELLLIRSC